MFQQIVHSRNDGYFERAVNKQERKEPVALIMIVEYLFVVCVRCILTDIHTGPDGEITT